MLCLKMLLKLLTGAIWEFQKMYWVYQFIAWIKLIRCKLTLMWIKGHAHQFILILNILWFKEFFLHHQSSMTKKRALKLSQNSSIMRKTKWSRYCLLVLSYGNQVLSMFCKLLTRNVVLITIYVPWWHVQDKLLLF